MRWKSIGKKIAKVVGVILLVFIIIISVFLWMVSLSAPEINNQAQYQKLRRDSIQDGWKSGKSWIHKNNYGLYEMYLEGKPYERGYLHGLLAEELVVRQEDYFVDRLNALIPSRMYQLFLKQIVLWLNKDLDENISDEYKQEIYGVSQFASPKYDYIAPKYQRILNYHGAHDIGHAMQNMNLVACSSFGAWNGYTADSSLLIARNFDFYAGDDFAQEKIILFVKPDSGYKLMMVTWGGFTGITSGMNEHGLTVTLNAAPSTLPSHTATPITLISRRILQYAKNIDEAFAIAKASKSFVSESFLIGSALDHKAVLIEKTPDTTILYTSPKDEILSTNHFQSQYFMNDPVNMKHKEESATVFRYNRLQQLLSEEKFHTPTSSVAILRNRLGWNNTDIGLSNENALNQLVAHHSILFLPEKKLVWVSSNPYQMGAYVCYDFDKIFSSDFSVSNHEQVYEADKTIAADPYLQTSEYADYVYYKVILQKLQGTSFKTTLTESEIAKFAASNPEYFDTHVHIAQYYIEHKAYEKALPFLKTAQTKVIPRKEDRDKIVKLISMCNKEI
ncbi:C45 family peptidase [uncultured Cytophaga sp.]|uniref:C45 family autoproteolytic acyltransferase/hydolase n=1 Tax=uncultured Cytophaga sp. TaxID=160238 RepID=UPI00261132CE|nr:C45 family peptidase [uncultured Cytophaga sp.]